MQAGSCESEATDESHDYPREWLVDAIRRDGLREVVAQFMRNSSSNSLLDYVASSASSDTICSFDADGDPVTTKSFSSVSTEHQSAGLPKNVFDYAKLHL